MTIVEIHMGHLILATLLILDLNRRSIVYFSLSITCIKQLHLIHQLRVEI